MNVQAVSFLVDDIRQVPRIPDIRSENKEYGWVMDLLSDKVCSRRSLEVEIQLHFRLTADLHAKLKACHLFE